MFESHLFTLRNAECYIINLLSLNLCHTRKASLNCKVLTQMVVADRESALKLLLFFAILILKFTRKRLRR